MSAVPNTTRGRHVVVVCIVLQTLNGLSGQCSDGNHVGSCTGRHTVACSFKLCMCMCIQDMSKMLGQSSGVMS